MPATDLSKAKKVEYVKTGQPKKRDLPELSTYMQYLDKVYETREPEEYACRCYKDRGRTTPYTGAYARQSFCAGYRYSKIQDTFLR